MREFVNKALVLNIQKFSLHDGDGIRTTIFFKGCGLHCSWCHNPESQKYVQELMRYEERCKKCGACTRVCPQGALTLSEDGDILFNRSKCKSCGLCVDYCAYDALEIAGKYYTAEELFEEVKKDIILYEESGGGVTLSGGEPMSQDPDFLLDLLKRLNRVGIKVNVDTSGFALWDTFEKIAPYVDVFLYDMKTIDKEKHEDFIGRGLDLTLSNLIKLNDLDTDINIRIPIIGRVNDDLSDMMGISNWLVENEIKVKQINILPYHKAGSVKYDRLGIEYEDEKMTVPSEEKIEEIRKIFEKNDFNNIYIGG